MATNRTADALAVIARRIEAIVACDYPHVPRASVREVTTMVLETVPGGSWCARITGPRGIDLAQYGVTASHAISELAAMLRTDDAAG